MFTILLIYCCNTSRTSDILIGQRQKSLYRLVLFSVNFVLLTCIADSSSENLTRLLKLGLDLIFLSFSFSLPSVFTNLISTLLRRFSIVLPNRELFISL